MRDCEDGSTRAITIVRRFLSDVFRPRRIRVQVNYYAFKKRHVPSRRREKAINNNFRPVSHVAAAAPRVRRVSRLALFGLAYFQILERTFRASCVSYLRRWRELDSIRAENRIRDGSRYPGVARCQAKSRSERSAARSFDFAERSAPAQALYFYPARDLDIAPSPRDVALNSAKEASKLADSGIERERIVID
jgi:hypothetical protein